MRRQLLICVETNKRANTDYVYITCALSHFYIESRDVSRRPIYLGTKTRYCDRKIQLEINQYRRGFPGETVVIYCIDMDECSTQPEQRILLDAIRAFCKQSEYDLVLFNRDVEDVYWGCQIADSEKVHSAHRFRESNKISEIRPDSLSSPTLARHQSNILDIFDKYLDRKVE